METFLVGGAVRDRLLGIDPDKQAEQDWLVIGATPEEMTESGYTPVGKEFPVFLHPDTKEEYALARTERKVAKGYKGFSFFTSPDITIEEDLKRRDLSINAIAQDKKGKLIDPYGGQQDIENRTLRHVSEAFSEDPLRVLRLARFAARFKHLGFSVADETLALCQEIAKAGELETLVAERVWQELAKALMTSHPEAFFETLREAQALDIIFPEVSALFGVEQRPEYHPEIDCGVHLMMSLQQSALLKASLRTRFAVLGHDFGKATTPDEVLPRHIGHEARSKKIVTHFCKRLRAPKDFQKLAELVAENHLLCHTAFELKPATLIKLFNKLNAFQDSQYLEEFLLACKADARGRKGFANNAYPQADYLHAMFESAKQVQAIQVDKEKFQGKAFGEQLNQLRANAVKLAKQHYDISD